MIFHHRLLATVAAFCFLVTSASVQLPAEQPPDSVRLRVVFPTRGDTLNYARIRFAGSVLRSSKISVQGVSVDVYRSGAFVGMTDLEPGHNNIVFSCADDFGEIRDTVAVFMEPSLVELPKVPTAIQPQQIFPQQDVYIMPGQPLKVKFLGSPGGRATFSINRLVKNVVLTTVKRRNSQEVRGWYEGTVLIPDVEEYQPKSVEFTFRGKDGRKLRFKSAGQIHLLSATEPVIAVTGDSTNLIFKDLEGDVLMELPPDIKMQIVGEQEGFAKVRLAEGITGNIWAASLRKVAEEDVLPFAAVGSIGTFLQDDWLQLRLNLSERVPFKIDQMLDPAALEVTFYRARQAPHWISYTEDHDLIKLLSWRQESDEVFVLRIELNQRQQWGYWGRFVGDQFRLNIRRTPSLDFDSDLPLKGLIVTVDPGHGGEFEGATSPTGLFEKHLNLKYATLVGDLLRAKGAEVIRTRTADTTLSLPSRVALASDANSHMFISLHNNSIGPATDPLRPRGTSTYYTVPHSGFVTKYVYKNLVDLNLHPFGMVSSSYFVTRQTRFLSFIVEGAFLSHPEDEMLLMDDTFVEQLSKAVVAGVEEFVFAAMQQEISHATNGFERQQPTEPEVRKFQN